MRLEPLSRDHEEGLWDASRDARTWTWLSIVQPATRDELRAYVDAALANRGRRRRAPVRDVRQATGASSGARASSRSARAPQRRDRLDVARPARLGTGRNVEAKLLMLEHAFERLGCRRVELKTDARNERSRGAMEALPAQFEGIHRKHMLVRGGESRDSAWYSVLDDEWPAVRANLLRRLGR